MTNCDYKYRHHADTLSSEAMYLLLVAAAFEDRVRLPKTGKLYIPTAKGSQYELNQLRVKDRHSHFHKYRHHRNW